jgi:hypothetical protein
MQRYMPRNQRRQVLSIRIESIPRRDNQNQRNVRPLRKKADRSLQNRLARKIREQFVAAKAGPRSGGWKQ